MASPVGVFFLFVEIHAKTAAIPYTIYCAEIYAKQHAA